MYLTGVIGGVPSYFLFAVLSGFVSHIYIYGELYDRYKFF